MKSLKHALHALLVLSLLSMSPVSHADPRPAKSTHSFKGGFSSQRSSSPPPRAPKQDASSSSRGGFGSFGSAPARSGQKSDSALSQRLDRNASEANALRTLDARKQAQEQAARDTRPVPGYENRQNNNQYNAPMPMPAPAPAQGSGSGLGGVVTGLVLGQIANGSHARSNNGYPAQVNGTGNVGTSSATVNQAPQRSFFGGVMRMFMWLVVLSAIGWLAYFLVQRKRRKTAENKPNYTFEGN